MTCTPTLGPRALRLEYSGLLESKAKKRASPVVIPLETIERVERGRLGRSRVEWCRIVVRDGGKRLPLTDDPLAFETWPGLAGFLDRLEAAVERGPVDPPTAPWPVKSPSTPGRTEPINRARTSSLDWLFGG